ncbi:MAG: FadR/GntR family transcriptional regulator [Pseudomonadota bacterium]
MTKAATAALVARIRRLMGEGGYAHNDRLPAERQLCEVLGVSRNRLRTALKSMEESGLIWRHIGRGTFVGARPVLNLEDVMFLRDQVSAPQIVAVRFTIEPDLARLAASHATSRDLDHLRSCAEQCRKARDWREYEATDHNLHHAIARASKNQLFLYFFETLNVVRRSMVWGQTRTTRKPARDYCSFTQHDQIVSAIAARDGDEAARAMTRHLESVYERILPELRLGTSPEAAGAAR